MLDGNTKSSAVLRPCEELCLWRECIDIDQALGHNCAGDGDALTGMLLCAGRPDPVQVEPPAATKITAEHDAVRLSNQGAGFLDSGANGSHGLPLKCQPPLSPVQMMVMDLCAHLRLGVDMDDTGHAQLISKLFALMTMKCEDGAVQAIKGQGRERDPAKLEDLANQLQSVGEEMMIIAQAARELAKCRR